MPRSCCSSAPTGAVLSSRCPLIPLDICMAVLFLAQESWYSFRKIGGRVFYYILLSKISLLIWAGFLSHACSSGKALCWMVEQELCVGLLPPPLLSHQRCLRNLKKAFSVDVKNKESHVVRHAGATQFPNRFGWSQTFGCTSPAARA